MCKTCAQQLHQNHLRQSGQQGCVEGARIRAHGCQMNGCLTADASSQTRYMCQEGKKWNLHTTRPMEPPGRAVTHGLQTQQLLSLSWLTLKGTTATQLRHHHTLLLPPFSFLFPRLTQTHLLGAAAAPPRCGWCAHSQPCWAPPLHLPLPWRQMSGGPRQAPTPPRL
jgi:hypothetical protein